MGFGLEKGRRNSKRDSLNGSGTFPKKELGGVERNLTKLRVYGGTAKGHGGRSTGGGGFQPRF